MLMIAGSAFEALLYTAPVQENTILLAKFGIFTLGTDIRPVLSVKETSSSTVSVSFISVLLAMSTFLTFYALLFLTAPAEFALLSVPTDRASETYFIRGLIRKD